MVDNNYTLTINRAGDIKGRLPFRLGCTSFVFPADVLPNVKVLSEHVDDIEILRFESDEISPMPSSSVIAELNEIADRCNVTYTIHLPVDTDIGAVDENERKSSVHKILRTVECFSSLSPFSYILHIPKPATDVLQQDNMERWLQTLYCSANELLVTDVDPKKISIETLDYPFEWLSRLFDKFDFSVCLDVGHLWLYGHDVDLVMQKYKERIRVVHLHGIKDGKDHCSISNIDNAVLSSLVSSFSDLTAQPLVVTLELFGHDKLVDSIKTISEIVNE